MRRLEFQRFGIRHTGHRRVSVGDDRPASPASTDDGAPTSLSTYAWGSHVCRRCDAESSRVWRDGDGFVCPDCRR
ncbi:hypothetical protein D8S78_04000 [Natrialba swarupiae]|nr:hypothetical protein [Natrialba swarupiae]